MLRQPLRTYNWYEPSTDELHFILDTEMSHLLTTTHTSGFIFDYDTYYDEDLGVISQIMPDGSLRAVFNDKDKEFKRYFA